MFVESITSEDPETSLRVVEEQLRGWRDRILIPRYWSELGRQETPHHLAAPGEIIHPAHSQLLQRALRAEGRALTLAADFRAEIEEYNKNKNKFVALATKFKRWMEERRIKELRELMSGRGKDVELIRSPGTHCMFIAHHNSRYASPDWQQTLKCFPDRAAMGRWARIVLWYVAQFAAGRTRGFANSYEDAHYLFTASYTRRLATQDVRLRQAAAALFPQIRLVETSSTRR